MKEKLQALADKILIRREEAAERTHSGKLLLPEVARQKTDRGTVVAVGPGRLIEGVRRPVESVRVGDRVVFARYSIEYVPTEGEELVAVAEDAVLARLE